MTSLLGLVVLFQSYSLSPSTTLGDLEEHFSITYTERFIPSRPDGNRILAPMVPKRNRYNARAGIINITENGEFKPERVRACIDYAKSIWENAVRDSLKFSITITYSDSIDYETITHVNYVIKGSSSIPVAYANLSKYGTDNAGEIIINTNTDWDYSIGDCIDPNKRIFVSRC